MNCSYKHSYTKRCIPFQVRPLSKDVVRKGVAFRGLYSSPNEIVEIAFTVVLLWVSAPSLTETSEQWEIDFWITNTKKDYVLQSFLEPLKWGNLINPLWHVWSWNVDLKGSRPWNGTQLVFQMLNYQSHPLCQVWCGNWAPGSAVNLPLQSPTLARNTHYKYYIIRHNNEYWTESKYTAVSNLHSGSHNPV